MRQPNLGIDIPARLFSDFIEYAPFRDVTFGKAWVSSSDSSNCALDSKTPTSPRLDF